MSAPGRAVAVVGPTASGKSALALMLAKRLGGEPVSADSMQIYRGMDIGTAKASAAERQSVRHHMLDIVEPSEDYSVSRYVRDASAICDDLIRKGIMPIIVGGTGLYIDSLLSGRSFSAATEDRSLRNSLEEDYLSLGGEEMLRRLSLFDPERAALLHPADKRRIIRAIEIYHLSGKTISEHDVETRAVPERYVCAVIFLNFKNRAALYERIDRRVDEMIARGLFREAEELLDRGIGEDSTALQAIGYKEAVLALRGELSREEAAERIKLASRRYAKRQITWFKRREDALRIMLDDEPDYAEALELSLDFIADYFGKGH